MKMKNTSHSRPLAQPRLQPVKPGRAKSENLASAEKENSLRNSLISMLISDNSALFEEGFGHASPDNRRTSRGQRTASDRGAHAPSRVAIGALADGIPSFYRKYTEFKDVAGEGASHDTRGSCASPECFAPTIAEIWEADCHLPEQRRALRLAPDDEVQTLGRGGLGRRGGRLRRAAGILPCLNLRLRPKFQQQSYRYGASTLSR